MATYELVTSNGTVLVDAASVIDDVTTEYKDFLGLGDDDTIDSSSTEGRMIDAEATSRISAAQALAYVQNQINPNLSDGTHFDAVYALLGGQRDAAEQSTCDCVMSGVSGTVIAAGSTAKDDNGELWDLVASVTIPASGSVTATFRSESYGAISAAIGEINTISSGPLGWEAITNEVTATEGKLEQSLVSAKLQRAVEIGANSRGVAYSVIAAVNKLDGVAGVSFRENRLSASQTIDGVTIPGKSMWLCVDGGAISEIAEKYATNTWGADFYGFSNTEGGSYTDPDSGQIYDGTIAIDRPTDVPLLIEVAARAGATTDVGSSVKSAIELWAGGGIEGYVGCSLGNAISPFEISAALNYYFGASSIYIQYVKISTVADATLGYDQIETALWEKCSITSGNITVVPL